MKIVEEYSHDSDRVLDRLVDGELNPADRRELLQMLEDEPGAWRRCALKFLEAQSLGIQLSRLVTEELSPPVATVDARRTSRLLTSGLWGLALAASLLGAFWLGTRMEREGAAHGPVAAGNVIAAVDSETARSKQMHEPSIEQIGSTESAAIDSGEGPAEPDDETLTLALADDDDPQNGFQLRMAAANESQLWPEGESAELSAELLQEIEQAGLEVRQKTRWLPVDLSDGRRAIVPVQEVQIHSRPN